MLRNLEAKLLAKTFKDRMSAYRKRAKRDEATQATVEEEECIYENIICALSKGSSNTPERQEFHSETNRGSIIFTMPGIELLDNDRVLISTEAGQVFEGITGRTFGYASHGETPFSEERIP